jgi:hypothetical protein
MQRWLLCRELTNAKLKDDAMPFEVVKLKRKFRGLEHGLAIVGRSERGTVDEGALDQLATCKSEPKRSRISKSPASKFSSQLVAPPSQTLDRIGTPRLFCAISASQCLRGVASPMALVEPARFRVHRISLLTHSEQGMHSSHALFRRTHASHALLFGPFRVAGGI